MDEDVRATERAWRASGSIEDQARHLAALVRSGRLPFGRLRLAARLGHTAAGVASGIVALDGRPIPPVRVEVATAIELGRAAREVRLRLLDVLLEAEPVAAVVAALALVDLVPELAAATDRVLRPARAWAAAGDSTALASAYDEATREIERSGEPLPGPLLTARLLILMAQRAHAAGVAWQVPVGDWFKTVYGDLTERHGSAPAAARWDAARAALLAWALGEAL